MIIEITLNWLAIVTATIAGVMVAFIWYTPGITFGRAWEKITGITKGGTTAFILLWITNFVTAIGFHFLINIIRPYYKGSFIGLSLFIGFVLWFAFSAATLVQHNAFEHKAAKLTLINTSYQLALYTAMALVFGFFG